MFLSACESQGKNYICTRNGTLTSHKRHFVTEEAKLC